jgi:hypothetical protein
LNVGKPKLLTSQNRQPYVGHPKFASRKQSLGPTGATIGDKESVAHAHESPECCFASVFVPISDEKRDGGRSFLRMFLEKADSVSPFPARIAPQGGKRADTDAI